MEKRETSVGRESEVKKRKEGAKKGTTRTTMTKTRTDEEEDKRREQTRPGVVEPCCRGCLSTRRTSEGRRLLCLDKRAFGAPLDEGL